MTESDDRATIFARYTSDLDEVAGFEARRAAEVRQLQKDYHDDGIRAQRRREESIREGKDLATKLAEYSARTRRLVGRYGATAPVAAPIGDARHAIEEVGRILDKAERDAAWLDRYRAAESLPVMAAPAPPQPVTASAPPPAPQPVAARRRPGCGGAVIVLIVIAVAAAMPAFPGVGG